MNMREEFEAWYQNEYGKSWKVGFNLNRNGQYFDDDIEISWNSWQAALAAQAQRSGKPYGYVTTLRNGTKHFYESMPYLDNAVKCDVVYLQAQAQRESCIECAGTGKKVIHDSFITVCDSCRGSGKEASPAPEGGE